MQFNAGIRSDLAHSVHRKCWRIAAAVVSATVGFAAEAGVHEAAMSELALPGNFEPVSCSSIVANRPLTVPRHVSEERVVCATIYTLTQESVSTLSGGFVSAVSQCMLTLQIAASTLAELSETQQARMPATSSTAAEHLSMDENKAAQSDLAVEAAEQTTIASGVLEDVNDDIAIPVVAALPEAGAFAGKSASTGFQYSFVAHIDTLTIAAGIVFLAFIAFVPLTCSLLASRVTDFSQLDAAHNTLPEAVPTTACLA